MNPQSPSAYALSALIHGAVVALILFFTYAANSVVKDAPRIFEMVAGAGDNYMATKAPALGNAALAKVAAAVAKPAPSPIQPAPLPAVPSAPAAPAKTPDLVAELKKVEARREARLEKKYQKEQEAERKRISQEEFQKQQAAKVAHIDAAGIAAGVIGGSTENRTAGAGGKALSREESSELDAYFSLLRSRIKESHVPPEGVSDALEARVEFFLAADGSISQIRIARSSGNREFDRSVIEACEHTRSIGARPDGRSETVQMTFRMREDEAP